MLFNRSSFISLVVVAMAVGLGGCVAVPLAQMAVSQMAVSQTVGPQMAARAPACETGPGCQTSVATNSFGDLSKGISNSFHSLMDRAPDGPVATPMK
ncbi:MAG: hypothetical protein QOH05_1131 [Acetobacteraceae bacterium]|jgi:hypothetical protein|nr:hypothetical protein [Acetobacteraceae bacterium]